MRAVFAKPVGLVAFVLVISVLTGAQAGKSDVYRTVKVSRVDYDISALPVSVQLPAERGDLIMRTDTGALVPCQVEREGDKLLVTWMVRKVRGGESANYRIQWADKSPKPDPRGVRLRKCDEAVDVTINGRLVTKYVFAGAPKPYCYPVIGPTGKPVTRSYPMREVEGEKTDHPHQRSFWFTFGDVNGIDFWSESAKAGKIVHRAFERLDSGPVYGWIRARNDWIAPDGTKVCEDTRDLRIYRTTDGRLMDFEVTIHATDGPVKFGDTKEGMMGFRVATSMDVDGGQGHVENSRGDRDGDTWGKQAEWCDYCGPVNGKTVGIAVMDHPSSFRHPTYWHVRTYGLCAANPFGLNAFTKGKIKDGSYTIPAGGEITFRYRILIHEGAPGDAGVAEAYAGYASPPAVTLE